MKTGNFFGGPPCGSRNIRKADFRLPTANTFGATAALAAIAEICCCATSLTALAREKRGQFQYPMEVSNVSLDEIPEKHRSYAQLTVAALRSIALSPDGLPADPRQQWEAYRAYSYANGLRARLAREHSPAAKALCAACTVLLDMVNAHRDGKRHPEWGSRWLSALARIPDVLPSEPVAVSRICEETELPLDSPEVQKMIAEDPDLLGFIGQALAADVEPDCEA